MSEGRYRRAIRLHPRRGHPPGLDLEMVPWSPAGRFTADDVDPGDLLGYHTGTCYPQDAASQVPVVLLDPRPGEVVVDACAAPGSKSTQIGLALGDDGLLVCCDASDHRRRILAENLARQGVACALVTPLPLHRLAERVGIADAVLVDAPCSGDEHRSDKQIARMAERQLAILADAAHLVRPGGRLVYSTCTPHRGEDEGVVSAFLATHRGWSVEPCTLPGTSPDLDGLGGIRLSPVEQGTEPFFAIRLRREGDEPPRPSLAGRMPSREATSVLPESLTWRHGSMLFLGSPQVAACALPSEARGLILAQGDRLTPWGAQAAIERGAPHQTVDHAAACVLWAGGSLADPLPGDALVATVEGMPLGQLDGSGLRLRLPSRMVRRVR